VKIKYATQVSTRPAHICIFTNSIEGVNQDYQNFIENEVRKKFHIYGVPIRFTLKKSENPFAHKAKQFTGNKTETSERFKRVLSKSQKNRKKV
jgi:GTP-binding protein